MDRKKMLEVVKELIGILDKKKVSPMEAEAIADVFERTVKKSNEMGKKNYMETGIFTGSPPEN